MLKIHHENRDFRLTVRITQSEHNLIKKDAKHLGMSQSNYIVRLLKESNNDNSYKSKIKPISSKNVGVLNKTISTLYDRLNQFRLDYARALANLEHDNDLYNHGQLQDIPRKVMEAAENAVLSNKKELQNMEADLNKIEMNLYDN